MDSSYTNVVERMKRVGGLKNDSALARVLKVTPQALSNYKKRGKMPTHLVIQFGDKSGLSVDWLLTGEGEVYRKGVGREGLLSYAMEEGEGYGKKKGLSKDFRSLTPDELIYIGKLLKILRTSNYPTITALKSSINAFLRSAEINPRPGPGSGPGSGQGQGEGSEGGTDSEPS